MSIRVLYLDHIPELSGGEIALLQMLQHLDRTQVEPMLVVAAEGSLPDRMRAAGIEVRVLPLSAATRHQGKTARLSSVLRFQVLAELAGYIWKLAGLIRRERIDLVHCNSLKADLYGALAARLAGRPVVWHLRDRVDRQYLSPAMVRVFRLGLQLLPNLVICNSASTMAAIAGLGRAPRVEIASGVPLPLPERLAHLPEPDPARPTVGMIGRIATWKGQREFLQAAAILAPEIPELEFWIVGAALFDADRIYEVEIRRQAVELGLGQRVRFLGFVHDVYPVMSAMDLVVHASVLAEPLGKVLLEAMAVARPVVATDLGGAREVVLDGVTGILVAPADPAALAGAIRTLLADPDLRRAMGRAGRQRVEDHYRVEATTRQVEEVYREMLAGSSR